MIAEAAHTTPSAINYAFGGVKHLFGSVFSDAIGETRALLNGLDDEADLWPADRAFLAHALQGVIEQWVTAARDLALLYQQALAHREIAPAEVDAWSRLWADYFGRLASRHGATHDQGALMNLLFQSEALFALSAWRPILERAALRDIVGHFTAVWLCGEPYRPSGALAVAEEAVRSPTDVPLEGPSFAMMMASVDVVAELGLAGLTHRAVATRCGVTAGAVAHYFRSAADLLAAAIRGQVVTLQLQGGPASRLTGVASRRELADVLVAGSLSPQAVATVRARRSLFLASLGDPNHSQSGAVVRYAAGATTRTAIRAALPEDPLTDLHASVLSRLLSALRVAAPFADASPIDAQALAASALTPFVDAVG